MSQEITDPSLSTRSQLALSAWCVVAAFGTYFCMYGFRKPFTAGAFDDITLAGREFKDILVIAQVLGYMVSKFLGIKVIAEVTPQRRAAGILALIGAAQAALLLFGLVPPPYNALCLFLNGLALGMVFGLVLGFLEGRQQTEALAAALCASFILADGVTKSAGTYLEEVGVGPFWMPFVAGLLFTAPLLLFVWMLTRIPPPTVDDVARSCERVPMDAGARLRFFTRYAWGLSLLALAYLLITVLRSVRADFAPEIWKGLGWEGQPEVFTTSEILVTLAVLACTGSCMFFRDNRRGFFAGMAVSLGGLVLIGVSLAGLSAGWLDGFAFMVLIGVGLYLPYVAVHTTLFERLIAMTRDRGNIGYLMYLADSFGYLGYVAVILAKAFWGARGNMLDFFMAAGWLIAVASLVMLALCWLYFAAHPAARTGGSDHETRGALSRP